MEKAIKAVMLIRNHLQKLRYCKDFRGNDLDRVIKNHSSQHEISHMPTKKNRVCPDVYKLSEELCNNNDELENELLKIECSTLRNTRQASPELE